MPSTSRTTAGDSTPSVEVPAASTRRLHVLITPSQDTRAILSTLAALSAAREPRLEVTAIAPAAGLEGWTFDRRFRVIPERDEACSTLIDDLELEQDSVVILIRAGSLPPRGWLATLLQQGDDTGARAIGAIAWKPNSTKEPEKELRRWEREAKDAAQNHGRIIADCPELETPLLAIFRPSEIATTLRDFWLANCATALALRPENPSPNAAPPRLLFAKDLIVWQNDFSLPIAAHIMGPAPAPCTPRTPSEANNIARRLHLLLESGPRPEIHLRLAELELARSDRSAAINHARACLDAWPECTAAKLLLARALTADDRLAPARSMIEQLLHTGPLSPSDRADVFACLGGIWLRSNDTAQAKPCIDVAIAIAPNHPMARYGQARIAQAAGRFGDALEHLAISLEAMPLSPDFHFEMGRAQVLAGLTDPGMRSLEHALQLDPEHACALELLERLDG